MTGFARNWGNGPDPALLLHCSLAHSGAWDGMAQALADRLTMVAPDLVGHGKADDGDRSRDYHDQVTAQAAAFMDDTPTHIVGHSFGATVALRLAIEHPSRVASLTLIEPVLFAAAQGTEAYDKLNTAFSALGPALEAGDDAGAAEVFIGIWGDGTPFSDLPEKQQAYLTRTIWVVTAGRPALYDDSANLLPRLDQVRCPVLLLEGDASPDVIGDIQSALDKGLPDTTRAVVEGAGHMGPITHPVEFASEIRSFLNRCREPTAVPE
ncbi:MAG: alpha/beta hydrolase [Pseudomonadota bacterium]